MEQNKWEDRILEICEGDPIAVTWISMTESLLLSQKNEIKEMISKVKARWVGVPDAEEVLEDLLANLEKK